MTGYPLDGSGLFGGIIVLWSWHVGLVTIVVISRLALHLVSSNSEGSWILTTVYKSQVLSEHKLLWNFLSGISHLNSPLASHW